MKLRHISADTLRSIHSIFETGVAKTEQNQYTEEQWDEILATFDEMYYEFIYKCDQH